MKLSTFWQGGFPQDKANHYMGGTAVCAVTDSLLLLALGAAAYALPQMTTLRFWAVGLALAALLAALAALLAGKLKEYVDQRANDKAAAQGQPLPHGVEVADWQFTAWGALPVALPQLVLAAIFTMIGAP